ncbi:MAG: hypothetical protein RMK52_01955 [Chitinophagales bacterium]|nr:hypothetical protein [Chitinophagales bacterium]MDW8392989.1 hypothetical protein [Chitinophagales bacterium]
MVPRLLLALLFVLCFHYVWSQNVGIGVSSPAQKLHVGLNTSTLRLEGLSSALGGTHIVAPSVSTDMIVFVNSNGDFKAMPNGVAGQVLSISAAGVPTWTTAATTDWTLLGNAGTNPATNFIGTTDNVDWVVRTNNTERMRVAAGGFVGINTAPSSSAQLFVSSGLTAGYSLQSNNTTTSGTAILGQITGAAGSGTAIGINGITNQANGFGVRGENNQAAGRAILGINSAASGTTANGAGVFGQIAQGASSTSAGGMGVVGVNTSSTGYGIHALGNNIGTFTFLTTGAGSLSSGSTRGGIGVANVAATTGSSTFGLQGLITLAPTGTGYSAAVRGDVTATSGAADGVSGVSASSSGSGVYGAATSIAAGLSYGVFGYHTSGSGNAVVGVGDGLVTYYTLTAGSGGAFSSDNVGAAGYATNAAAIGLQGVNVVAASTSTGIGVLGQTSQSQGYGVYGVQTNAISSAAHFGPAVLGSNSAATGAGYGDGVGGLTNQQHGFGVYGFNGNNTSGTAGGTGVFGAGNNQLGFYLAGGSGGAFTGRRFGVYGRSGADSLTADNAGGYFYSNLNAFAYVGARIGGTNYKITGTGSVATWVRDLNNEWRIMHAPEAPEPLLTDYGTGQLVNGFAHVALDPIFSKNIQVDANNPLRVFIQLEGDCKGVYVTNKTATGFDVVELQGGTSNVSFSWQVVASRADEYNPDGTLASKFAGKRFDKAPQLPESASSKHPDQFEQMPVLPENKLHKAELRLKIRSAHEQNIATGKVE